MILNAVLAAETLVGPDRYKWSLRYALSVVDIMVDLCLELCARITFHEINIGTESRRIFWRDQTKQHACKPKLGARLAHRLLGVV